MGKDLQTGMIESDTTNYRNINNKAKNLFNKKYGLSFAEKYGISEKDAKGFNYLSNSERKEWANIVREGNRNEFKPSYKGAMAGYGLKKEIFEKATAKHHLSRALNFTNPFSVANKEAAFNSLGILTKHQKILMKKDPSFLNKTMHSSIPVISAGLAVNTLYNGGDMSDWITQHAATEFGFMYGWRATKAYGAALGKSLGMKTVGTYATGFASGLVGAIGGAAVVSTLADGIMSIGKSDNAIRVAADNITSSKITTDRLMTEGTLTQRQRSLMKLSKSALNDRGTLLGNESLILRGIL